MVLSLIASTVVHDRAALWYAPIVRQAWRIVGGVLAIGLVVYAIIALSTGGSGTSSSDRKPRRVTAASDTEGDDESDAKAKRTKVPSTRADGDRKAQPRALGLDAATPTPTPENVDYDKARTELEKLVDQVEDMAARGEHMDQKPWVEIYRKGDSLMVSLMRTPEVASSNAVRNDLGKLNQRFRMAVTKIGPAPAGE
jgi:hypothetical protein